MHIYPTIHIMKCFPFLISNVSLPGIQRISSHRTWTGNLIVRNWTVVSWWVKQYGYWGDLYVRLKHRSSPGMTWKYLGRCIGEKSPYGKRRLFCEQSDCAFCSINETNHLEGSWKDKGLKWIHIFTQNVEWMSIQSLHLLQTTDFWCIRWFFLIF